MDEYKMKPELFCALTELASVISQNDRREAEAVQGYTEQLRVIVKARNALQDLGDGDAIRFLDKLYAATEEKIADELSHGSSLIEEYVSITGITPKED